MPNVKANGIEIEYETFGDEGATPMLLIMGAGAQMIVWDEEICEQLARHNFFVIRFDNRDVGLSSKFEEADRPDLMKAFSDLSNGKEIQAGYTLDDMADDATGLLTSLGLDQAHICGISLGAAIAQTIVIKHPSRVLSLISISGTTGNPQLPPSKPEAVEVFMQPLPKEREAYINRIISDYKIFFGSGFWFDEKWFQNMAARLYDRCFYPQGTLRQILALMAHGDRSSALQSVTTPTLIVHGDEDPVVPVECGRDTANSIPGAELMIVKGMGHDMPHGGAWPQIVDRMVEHMKKTTNGLIPLP